MQNLVSGLKRTINPLRGLYHLKLENALLALENRLLFKPFRWSTAQNVSHIVVRRDGNIGDAILALPALQRIRQAYPDAVITVLTTSAYLGPLKVDQLPTIDEVLCLFPNLVNHYVTYKPQDLMASQGIQQLQKKLLAHGPLELFIDLPYCIQRYGLARKTMWLARQLGFHQAIGFEVLFPSILKEAYAQRFSSRIEKSSAWHESVLRRCGFPDNMVLTNPQNHTPMYSGRFEALLSRFALDAKQPVMVINAGAKIPIKFWPASHFTSLIEMVYVNNPLMQFVLLGSQTEIELNQGIVDDVLKQYPGVSIRNLAGLLTVGESLFFVAGALGVVSNDTGTAHMAGLFNVPVVIPSSGQYHAPLWHPMGSNYRVLQHEMACTGCYQDVCPLPEQQCLLSITPGQVLAALTALIQALETQDREPLLTEGGKFGLSSQLDSHQIKGTGQKLHNLRVFDVVKHMLALTTVFYKPL